LRREEEQSMPKRKRPKLTNKEQYARFVETAKAVQEDGAEKRFEKACEKILKTKRGK
jgi:uncharacterized protein YdeI (YjbR/CyaY-like superfamily)